MGTELLTETFIRLQDRLHRVAGKILRDELEADDAVQDTFCNLWMDRLPDSTDEARYRLFAVLKNVCLNKLKRKRASTGSELPDIPVDPPDYPEAGFIGKLLLGSLTETQREVFGLYVRDELEYDEIAERLGMSREAVRMHICRARKTLRIKYKELNR